MTTNKTNKEVSECCGAYPRWNSLAQEFYCQKCGNACRTCHQQPERGLPEDFGKVKANNNEPLPSPEPSKEEVTVKNVWVGLSGVCRLNGKPSREWEEEFDETYHIYRIGEWSEQIIPNSCKPTPIKSYIPNLLLSERTALVESIINELESNPNEDGSTSPNIQHWIEVKQRQLKAKFLTRKS